MRLILAFSAMVLLLLFVGLASYVIHYQVVARVETVRQGAEYDLMTHNASRTGLEITGYWNPAGAFIAEDVEPTFGRPDPRLRGVIQQIDAAQNTIRMYGIDIDLSRAKYGEDEREHMPVRASALRVGQRVEVKCEVDDGVWAATRIDVEHVNESNKIKGMVTRKDLDGQPPESIFIHGLEIVVEARRRSSPDSALAHIEQATRMIDELQSVVSAAHEMAEYSKVAATYQPLVEARERISQSNGDFSTFVYQGYGVDGDRYSAPVDSFRDRLGEIGKLLENQQNVFIGRLTALAGLEEPAHDEIYQIVHEELDPFVTDRMMPQLVQYLHEGEEELNDQLRALKDRTSITPVLAMSVSFVAAGLAIVLGWLVWRSIHRPIQQVQAAALRLGQGHLDTRIELKSRDELGMLADAFNTMASRLSSTTVSMASLESVFDSMAAALVVLSADGRITNVNRATCELLDRERAELHGLGLDAVCRFEDDEVVRPIVTVGRDGEPIHGAASIERVFLRKDGSELPVALSGAELRSADGPVQGYVCVAQDLTEQKRIQETIRESLAEKELLLREVHHRVKNNMQVITSLLAMQTNDGEPEVVRRLQDSQNRIRTIALIHEQLYLSAELAHIDLHSYLAVLTQHLLQSFGATDRVELKLRVDDVGLDVDQSLSIGLIVNELMTNSMKYAFANERAGKLRVELFANGDGSKTLLVADDGPGFSADGKAAGRQTLGTSLVRTLSKQLKGVVEVDSSAGTTTRIVFGKPKTPQRASREAVVS